jgi:hypothetical protein
MGERMKFPERAPQFEVWNHLESGLDHARQEFNDYRHLVGSSKHDESVGSEEQQALEAFADFLFDGLSVLATHSEHTAHGTRLAHILGEPNAAPWIDFASDLRFAEEGVRRARLALDRYRALRLQWTTLTLSDRAYDCLREAVHTYLFGFDAACVAFCGVALERILKDALVSNGAWTRDQADFENRVGKTVLNAANREHLISDTYADAERVLKCRGGIVHSGARRGGATDNMAIDCLRSLGRVLQELSKTTATDA